MKRAFTLAELLVVIIIVGILASLALPKFGRTVDKAMELEAKTSLRQIQTLQKNYYLTEKKFTTDLDAIAFDPPSSDAENGDGARYTYSIESASDEDFVAIAVPTVKDLGTFTISKSGKAVERK